MSKKKEKLLKKYLDKKKKQRKRDEILAQIAEIERKNLLKQTKEEKMKIEKKDYLNTEEENGKILEIEDEYNTNFEMSYQDVDKKTIKSSSVAKIDIFCKDIKNEQNTFNEIEVYNQNYEGIINEKNNEKNLNNKIKINVQNRDEKNIEILKLSDENIHKNNLSENTFNQMILKNEQISNLSHENSSEFMSEDSSLENIFEIYEKVKVNRKKEIDDFRKTLPIIYEQNEIISKIKKNTVILIKGETGCGKSTQIPQFLYEAGLAKEKMIGITQPRRLAALGLSQRISIELNSDITGYHIRYDNNITKDTKLKIMTDGILLKEIQEDFLLTKYSVIILDEIHERNVNMDILIPLLKKIIKIRFENNDKLTLILMSASKIDQDIINYFEKIKIIDVSSNSHKVSIFYEDRILNDLLIATYQRIKKIMKIKSTCENNTILVFLPSKIDIFKLQNILLDDLSINDLCVVLPLYSSLSKDEQNLIYKDFEKRKIILSTNISETSITIPDVYYVIDLGLVKNKILKDGVVEYSIDYISQSSAQQRAGRAGRTGPGICYRLYTGQIYNSMDESNVPKIFYEPLENILIDLINLGINNLHKFPYINKPSDEKIDQSLKKLIKLNILSKTKELTQIGKCLSCLPLSPNIGKLLCVPNTKNILPELIDLACIMSVNIELKKNEFTKKYYVDEKSDLIVILKIFRDFLKNRKKFKLHQNISSFEEVAKMSNFIRKKFNLDYRNELSFEIKNQLRFVLFNTFKDQISVLYDGFYYYRNKEVKLSNNSIDIDGECVIFEYLLKGTKNIYMKNITVLDIEWFNTK